jgi:hypothetical protein
LSPRDQVAVAPVKSALLKERCSGRTRRQA